MTRQGPVAAVLFVAIAGAAAAGIVLAVRPSRDAGSATPAMSARDATRDAGLAARADQDFRPAASPGGDPASAQGPALAAWLRRLDSPDRAARGDALVRLRTLGPRAATAASRVLDVFREGDADLDLLAARALAAMGPAGVEAVEDALQSPDVRVRAGALSTLAMIETLGPRSVSALERGLADPDERVRAAAIAGYGAHPETAKDVDGLLARLDDGSDRVRAAAALALGRLALDPDRTVPALARRLRVAGDPDDVRLETIWAIARFGSLGGPAADALAEIAVAGPGPASREAARALVRTGPAGKAAVPTLLRAVEGPDEAARARAIAALAAIAPGDPTVTPRLEASVRPRDPASAAAVAGLVVAGDAGRAALARAAASPEGRTALAATTLSIERGAAGEALRRGLDALVDDADDGLALLALRSLADAGARASASASHVARALAAAPHGRWNEIARTLGEIGEGSTDAADALLVAARDGDPATRVTATRALGLVGVASAPVVAFLSAASSDPALGAEARRARARLVGGG